jgi:hypothetical protein
MRSVETLRHEGCPPNYYCTPKHKDEQKYKQAIERAQAHRVGKSVDEYPPRKAK